MNFNGYVLNQKNTTFLLLLVLTLIFVSPIALAKKNLVFSGGPAGGTFQIVASAVQVYPPVKSSNQYRIRAQSSAGSVENLRKINAGKAHFAVVHSGHAYLGGKGLLKNDKKVYDQVMAVSYLYSSPAQLVVKKGSGIKTLSDLKGKKVGVGNAGSGAFANCELFFTHMGLWGAIERNALGYNDAAQAFGNGQLDAFWLFTGFPSGAVMMASQTNEIQLIDLSSPADSSGFYKQYPYFTQTSIPANTYRNVGSATPTFQDSAIWVANKKVSEDIVYDVLSKMYTEEGLEYMRSQKSTFKAMTIDSGLEGIVTPLHPGAKKFWREKGLLK